MERRLYPRCPAVVCVRVEADHAVCEGQVRDINRRGIYLEIEAGLLNPSIDRVRLHFEIDTGRQVLSRAISGEIVRDEGVGLAVRFAEDDVLARAVVHEVLYYMQAKGGDNDSQTKVEGAPRITGAEGS